jgi:hypothetical protein
MTPLNKNAREVLTADALHQLIDYNPETGEFFWAATCMEALPSRQTGQRSPGAPVKWSPHSTGYQQVRLGCRYGSHLAHRLAWLHETGSMPPKGYVLDHENGIKTDNRYDNIRIATQAQNMANSLRVTQTKRGLPRGVVPRGNHFHARIKHKDRLIYSRVFTTPEEAGEEYVRMKTELKGRDFVWREI